MRAAGGGTLAAQWRVHGGPKIWCWRCVTVNDDAVNEMQITQLRQERGWTQEKLAAESRVGLRTIQRLESGSDASLETLSLVAKAFDVAVRDLFVSVNDGLEARVLSLDARTADQQLKRDRITSAWRWLFIGVGVTLTLFCFVIPQYSTVLFIAYWSGGLMIFLAIRKLYLEPRLDERFPLSNSSINQGPRWKRNRTPDAPTDMSNSV
jgi:transcriptional regulator with XRE-family HTH domain